MYKSHPNKLQCKGNTTLFSEDQLDLGLWVPSPVWLVSHSISVIGLLLPHGMHQSLGLGESLHVACKKRGFSNFKSLCSLFASLLSKHSVSGGSMFSHHMGHRQLWWRQELLCLGSRPDPLGAHRTISLCPKETLQSKTCVFSHQLSPLLQPREIPSCTCHSSKPLCFFCEIFPSSVGLELRKHEPENLAAFLFCALLCSCLKATNQKGALMREKKGKALGWNLLKWIPQNIKYPL